MSIFDDHRRTEEYLTKQNTWEWGFSEKKLSRARVHRYGFLTVSHILPVRLLPYELFTQFSFLTVYEHERVTPFHCTRNYNELIDKALLRTVFTTNVVTTIITDQRNTKRRHQVRPVMRQTQTFWGLLTHFLVSWEQTKEICFNYFRIPVQNGTYFSLRQFLFVLINIRHFGSMQLVSCLNWKHEMFRINNRV